MELEGLAQRIEPKVTWADLILAAEPIAQLHQIAEQLAARRAGYETGGSGQKSNGGRAITALFTGPSDAAKTMAAEAIATDLRLDLYRIDLSSVVSNYIGETGKNLRRVFDAADDGGAILFVDEADALFGKRTEVKDSHDRYANTEIAYLLQHLESYRGLVILATNLKSALDPAFIRRLRFIVDFPMPIGAPRKSQ